MSYAQAPRPEMTKRVMDVEDALRWAYNDELPKDRGLGGKGPAEPCEVSPMFRHAALGTRVDSRSYEPKLPAALGEPHPDALMIEKAVAGLSALADREIAGALQLAPDFAASHGVDEHQAIRRALGMASGIVARCAKLRRRPFWQESTMFPGPLVNGRGNALAVRWEPIFSKDMNGSEVEHEALVPIELRSRGEYPFGAYCPLSYSPTPASIVDERAEYLAWWWALDHLASELQGRLTSVGLTSPSAAQLPWLDAAELGRAPRVFADLTSRTYRREARETAAAHRALGARRSSARRGAERFIGAPRRAVQSTMAATKA